MISIPDWLNNIHVKQQTCENHCEKRQMCVDEWFVIRLPGAPVRLAIYFSGKESPVETFRWPMLRHGDLFSVNVARVGRTWTKRIFEIFEDCCQWVSHLPVKLNNGNWFQQ